MKSRIPSLLLATGATLLFANCSSSAGDEPFTPASSPTGSVSNGECRPGQASAQFRAQELPPLDMVPGTHATVSVTFDNCSGRTWSKGAFALRPNAPADDSTWSVGRVELPFDVPDGARVTLLFSVTAPIVAGVYPFTWRIAGDVVGGLQEPSPSKDVTVRFSADCTQPGPPARFQGWKVPSFVATGGKLEASVVYANCSTQKWSKDDGWFLGADDETWGTARVELPIEVPSQTQVTIPVVVDAPKTPGVYKFGWKIRHDAAAVEEPTPITQVTALEPYDCPPSGPTSRFVREDGVPGTINPGAGFDAKVTFANCGVDVWNGGYHVGAADPSNDSIWGAGRVALPYSVAHGYAISVNLKGRAPGSPGNYPYRWTVVQDGNGPIDEPSPNHSVSVRCVPSCGDHTCGGDGCGGSCGSCGEGTACDGAYCRDVPDTLSCGNIQWWNSALTYGPYMSYGWWDTDLAVPPSSRVQIRHASRLDKTGVYAWGYMPEFTDTVTGKRFRLLHLRPAYQWATTVGKVYPAGYVVGLSGGDTADTGLGPYSTGAHLCVQTLEAYRTVFPTGWDACK